MQYFFNTDILELVEKAEKSQKRENKYLEEAKDLLKKRNKLIRIADKNPGGGLLSMSMITTIMHQTLMTKSKFGPWKIGHYAECLGINLKGVPSLMLPRLLLLLAVSTTCSPLYSPILGQGSKRGHFQETKEMSFVTFASVPQATDRCFQCREFGHWRRYHYNGGASAQQTEAVVTKEEAK